MSTNQNTRCSRTHPYSSNPEEVSGAPYIAKMRFCSGRWSTLPLFCWYIRLSTGAEASPTRLPTPIAIYGSPAIVGENWYWDWTTEPRDTKTILKMPLFTQVVRSIEDVDDFLRHVGANVWIATLMLGVGGLNSSSGVFWSVQLACGLVSRWVRERKVESDSLKMKIVLSAQMPA